MPSLNISEPRTSGLREGFPPLGERNAKYGIIQEFCATGDTLHELSPYRRLLKCNKRFAGVRRIITGIDQKRIPMI
jgi:hypothetical protein